MVRARSSKLAGLIGLWVKFGRVVASLNQHWVGSTSWAQFAWPLQQTISSAKKIISLQKPKVINDKSYECQWMEFAN